MVVWAACASHAGGQLRAPRSDAEQDKLDRVFAAWDELRTSLAAARPDALIVVGTDHMLTFSFDLMPIFAIGRGDEFATWGELGTGTRTVPGAPELADALHADLVDAGFDVAGSVGMRLDHAYSCPLAFLDPVPIVPLTVNVFAAPRPASARCRALGAALGRAIERREERVAILATGGISHAIGVPHTGRIDPAYDRRVLDLLERADIAALEDLPLPDGAAELRCWMVALGAAGSRGARRLAYEPVEAWLTGMALVEIS